MFGLGRGLSALLTLLCVLGVGQSFAFQGGNGNASAQEVCPDAYGKDGPSAGVTIVW